jgi:hypothetical protein
MGRDSVLLGTLSPQTSGGRQPEEAVKLYVLMTSITLAAGAALGYWTGKGSAQKSFASGCDETGFVAVYDYKTEALRHFHCFELELPQRSEPREQVLKS